MTKVHFKGRMDFEGNGYNMKKKYKYKIRLTCILTCIRFRWSNGLFSLLNVINLSVSLEKTTKNMSQQVFFLSTSFRTHKPPISFNTLCH